MATVGHYSVYAALLQTIVEGPEFADALDDLAWLLQPKNTA